MLFNYGRDNLVFDPGGIPNAICGTGFWKSKVPAVSLIVAQELLELLASANPAWAKNERTNWGF